MNPPHVVTVSSEMVPFAKTGGLGDVCGALPPALESLGCRCTAFLPAYPSVLRSGVSIEPTATTFAIEIADRHVTCRLLRAKLPSSDVDLYLIDQPHYFDRDGLYNGPSGEFRDNCERFCFFSRSVVWAIEQLGLAPDIVHCHDWQTGLIPAYIKTGFRDYGWMKRARSLLTIHNLAYQGTFWHLDMPLTGLSWEYFNWEQMEFHGQLNLLKTGIVFADRVTTVSPTYSREITTEEHGCGLQSILASRGESLTGIVNGVDYQQWDPATDQFLAQNYSIENWQSGKLRCKAALQNEFGLHKTPEVPLVGIVSRIADQKGWDLIIPLLNQYLESHDVQWAILGTGDPRYEAQLADLANRYPHKLGVRLEFSEAVAHQIEAASDMFLMPSRYEPCGLNQLYSLKYGSVPVVNATGGLVDTVLDAQPDSIAEDRATGFVCPEYSVQALEKTLARAVNYYLHEKAIWSQIVEAGMRDDWSWHSSAQKYLDIYNQLRVQDSLRT